MAIGTSGDGAVLLRMAGGAGDITMASRGGGPLSPGLLVASNAVIRCDRLPIIQGGGHVRLMAETAVGFDHGRGMGCVAGSAGSLGSMPAFVAGGTRQFTVAAGQPLQLFSLQGMAGKAHLPDISLQLDVQGGMRIVTTAATGQFIMCTTRMAHGTGGYILLLGGAVPFMARLAGDRTLVGHALLGDGQTLPHMTLFAVGVVQLRWPLGGREGNAETGDEQNTENNGQPESAALHGITPL